jgi:hypothetical protein
MEQNQSILFKIPAEIRHEIYSNVARLAIDWPLVTRYAGDHSRKIGFFTTLVENPGAKLSLPWLHLRLTCKAVAEDLERYMSSESFLGADENHTLVVDIIAAKHRLGSASLRRVPCQPSHIQGLVANLDFRDRVRFWGNGGLMGIVRDLYQTLNWILHYGPVFTRQSPLAEPLRLKTLAIRVTTGAELSENSTVHERFRFEKFWKISDFIRTLRGAGFLWGYIDNISVSDELGHENHYQVEQVANARVPRHWDRYGFEWGLEAKHAT